MIGRRLAWSFALAIGLAIAGSRGVETQLPTAPKPAASPSNPCALAALEDEAVAPEQLATAPRAARRLSKPSVARPRDPGRTVLDALWTHRAAARRGLVRP